MKPDVRRKSFFEAPDFWVSDFDDVNAYLDGVRTGDVREIGRSVGGRPIRSVSYGEKEPVDRKSTLSGAIGSRNMESFFGSEPRKKPVLMILSTIHGAEIEGTVSCLNAANVMETGVDLRGRRWDTLHELFESMRVILVPIAQPDGRVRSAVKNLVGGSVEDLYYYGQGLQKDGTLLTWPKCKERQPIPLDEMQFLGGYYNDAVLNIQHEDFFAPALSPESRALIDLVREETPDCVVTLHSCGSGPFFTSPDAFIPKTYQYRQSQINSIVAERHRREGLRPGGGPHAGPTGGFYFHTALHHASGCLPLVFETPTGWKRSPLRSMSCWISG
jgi:hypothetical protein